jgi:predicted MFS family arabinose efflux permease
MQNVGAAWLMISLGAGPLLVALTQTASSLPFFVLALPAGSAGDIFDRRKLLLATQIWMVVVAIAIALLTAVGWMSPWLLLVLTFALSCGATFASPTWRAILPELVGNEDLAAGAALNGIEFNFARAIGPALGGIVIAAASVAMAFFANVLSFFGVIVVVSRWKATARQRTAPPEMVGRAIVAGLRYIRYSPAIRAVMVRQGATMFFASALLALLPNVAHQVSSSANGYGILLGAFGVGAILGALMMQAARSRWSLETVVLSGVAVVGAMMLAIARLDSLGALAFVLFIAGAAWITFVSLISALIQTIAPGWVQARVVAVFLLVFQGSIAVGSAFWGAIAQRVGIRAALAYAGAGILLSMMLALGFKFPQSVSDLTPWPHWGFPGVLSGMQIAPSEGPVLVMVEYSIGPERKEEFLALIHQYSRIRRRDGASRWGIYYDSDSSNRFIEVFEVSSWAEHLRQHERFTQADRDLETRLYRSVQSTPKVQHLIYASR